MASTNNLVIFARNLWEKDRHVRNSLLRKITNELVFFEIITTQLKMYVGANLVMINNFFSDYLTKFSPDLISLPMIGITSLDASAKAVSSRLKMMPVIVSSLLTIR
jgi:hypothetical protein